jgi:hypothetical protein
MTGSVERMSDKLPKPVHVFTGWRHFVKDHFVLLLGTRLLSEEFAAAADPYKSEFAKKLPLLSD